jgi:hypothetical protein
MLHSFIDDKVFAHVIGFHTSSLEINKAKFFPPLHLRNAPEIALTFVIELRRQTQQMRADIQLGMSRSLPLLKNRGVSHELHFVGMELGTVSLFDGALCI